MRKKILCLSLVFVLLCSGCAHFNIAEFLAGISNYSSEVMIDSSSAPSAEGPGQLSGAASSSKSTTADPPAGSDTPADPPAGSDTPADPPAGNDTPADPPAGSDTPADPPAGSETPVDPSVSGDTSVEQIYPDPTKPMIALTFDDGPCRNTNRLLDIFAKHGGKTTFFVVGNMIDSRPDVLRRIAAEGHEIGSHTWNHPWLTKQSEEQVRDQFVKSCSKIKAVAGVDVLYVRPPYGAHNAMIRGVAKELGISLINWSVDTLDWMHKDTEYVYNSVMSQAEDGAIILCHDLHETTVNAMERIIPDLIDQGYQLVTVSQLLSRNGGKILPGEVYSSRAG